MTGRVSAPMRYSTRLLPILWGLPIALACVLLLRGRGNAPAVAPAAGPAPNPHLALTPARQTPPTGRSLAARALAWLTVVAPLALWAASLSEIDLDHIGRYGLAASLPVTWYAALAIVLLGAVRTIFAPRLHGILVAAHIVVAVVIVYATIPAVADMPQYAWTYKHIGVTKSIEQLGSVAPLVDIYHRWPAFFALAAAFSRVSGLGDPLSYAAWAEPLFSLLGALLVAAIAHTVSRDARVAAVAALFFVLTAWLAQSYFAPQPLAYVLGLTVMLVALRELTAYRRLPQRLVRLIGAPAEGSAPTWSRRTTLTVLLALDAVVVVTHQLTPYMILLSLLTLAVFGVLRPRWIVLAAAVLLGAYLVPNLGYVRANFPLFASVNPGENARVFDTTEPWLVAHAGGMVSGCMWILALLATGGLLKRRGGVTPLMVLALAITPACILFGVKYGGEASLRVHYFAAPWLAILVAWGLATLPRPGLRAMATLAALAAVTALFLIAFFARTALNVIPRDEVQASAYFYEHAEPRSLLVLVNPGFPMRVAARYTLMRPAEGGDTSPNLMARQNAQLVRRASVPAVLTTLRQLAPAGTRRYLVFSRTQARYADVNRILSFAQTRRLEDAVARSPQFRLWHRTANTRIFEAVGP
jgi:hypothetical protein